LAAQPQVRARPVNVFFLNNAIFSPLSFIAKQLPAGHQSFFLTNRAIRSFLSTNDTATDYNE
jgi:hypothetical protein